MVEPSVHGMVRPPRDLSDYITPTLLDTVLDIRFPWPVDQPLDFSGGVMKWSNKIPEDARDRLYSLTWPVLMSLSNLGPDVDAVPDLMSVLPAPSAPEFPSRALALVILLDQVPRFFCSTGTNVRWLNSFFDPLIQGVVAQFFALPETLQPHRRERWVDADGRGYSYDHWLVRTLHFLGVLDHSESPSAHRLLHGITARMREEVEATTGRGDPFAPRLMADMHNPLAFSRWMRAGPPWRTGEDIEGADYAFYRLAITDIHKPIIERFGRYPWRNGAMGRTSTPKEMSFLEESNHFANTDAEVAAKIREDIINERWSALLIPTAL